MLSLAMLTESETGPLFIVSTCHRQFITVLNLQYILACSPLPTLQSKQVRQLRRETVGNGENGVGDEGDRKTLRSSC